MDPDQNLQKQINESNLGQSKPEAMTSTLGWSWLEATNSTGMGLTDYLLLRGPKKASSTGAGKKNLFQ